MKQRICVQCGKTIARPIGSQKYCSEKCKKEAEFARDNPALAYAWPSKNEKAIMQMTDESQKPGSQAPSYGKFTASLYQQSHRETIKAPEGFTSHNERRREKNAGK